MKRLAFLALLTIFSLPLMASAQEVAPKAEIFGGYSLLRVSPDVEGVDSISANGFNLSVSANITRNFGIVGEFGRVSKSESFGEDLDTLNAKASVQTYLFGPRFAVRTGKAEPFFHGLVGVARGSLEVSEPDDPEDTESGTGYAFAYVLGGGVDVKVRDNFAIRVAQLDFVQARVQGEGINAFRFSTGVVFRLGNR
jgi:opacity protein-like surface antigen